MLIQPASTMEDYFRTLGKLSGKPNPEEMAALVAKHTMQIVGPPLPVH